MALEICAELQGLQRSRDRMTFECKRIAENDRSHSLIT